MASGRTDSCAICVSLDWRRQFLPAVQSGVATGGTPGSIAAPLHGYVTNNIIKFDTVGITTLSLLSFYHVIYIDDNTFELASTSSGAPINFTNTDTVSFEQVILGCHKRAPDAPQGTVPVPSAQWQDVSLDYWCREFEPSAPAVAREVLTAARTYYVRTDGSDSNNGLTNTAAGAFLTIQGAITTIAMTIDTSIYNVTIQCAAGTYSSVSGNSLANVPGNGWIIIVGDEVTPANVVVTTTGSSPQNFSGVNLTTIYSVRGFKLTSTGAGNPQGISSAGGSWISVRNVDFSTGFYAHIGVATGGVVDLVGSLTISGGANNHLSATVNGIVHTGAYTHTVTGTPAFAGSFADSSDNATIHATGSTYSGAATGTRYTARINGVIDTNGGGANFFPGNAPGSTGTGGQYA